MHAARLLIVEDHADSAEALRRILQRRGFAVSVAPTVAEAIRLCHSQPFDLLIVDLKLPDGEGSDLLRSEAACADIPAIALTGLCMPADVEHTRVNGFCQHLCKPIHLPELLAAIQRALDATCDPPLTPHAGA